MPWLEARTIFLTRHGSHAYGTNIKGSDEDVKGIAVPPRSYFTGFTDRFEQAESKDPDAVVFDVRKFFNLAAQCNPNIIEVLFADESDHLRTSVAGDLLRKHRKDFITRKARYTFCGYAVSQMKRIKSHRRWLLDPPKGAPDRSTYGLPDPGSDTWNRMNQINAAVKKVVDGWSIDWSGVERDKVIEVTNHIESFLGEVGYTTTLELEDPAARYLGLNDESLSLLRKERLYREDMHHWKNYLRWKDERNPSRQVLEQKFGYDTKHANHLVRLMRMCREILTDGSVLVKRPDAEELKAIRAGGWSFDRLLEWSEEQEAQMQVLYDVSPLPKAPDMKRLNQLCQDVVELAMQEFGE